MALKDYDFKEVAVILGGVQITGFSDDTDAISIEDDADQYAEFVGNDGETTRSKSNNALARCTLKLAQSAESNAYLQGLLKAGSIVPFFVKDGSGNSLHVSEQAYVKRQPTAGFGREVNSREWIIVCPDMIHAEAGN